VFISTLLVAVVVFVSTNIDDIFLLSAFFAEPRLAPRSVVAGQFCGIGVLVVASAAAALGAIAIPDAWVALLGLVPLGLGIWKLWSLRTSGSDGDDADSLSMEKRMDSPRSQVFAVMGVTIANGGDNLSIYVPLFASDFRGIPLYVVVFAILTAVWCAIGYALVNNRVAGRHIRRYGHVALPFVLIGLGLYILSGAVALLE